MHPQQPLHMKKTEQGKVVLLTCVSFLPPPQEKQINSRASGQFSSIQTLQKFHNTCFGEHSKLYTFKTIMETHQTIEMVIRTWTAHCR